MSLVTTADRYWQTLRHLRPGQIWGRVLFRLARPTPDISSAPPRRALRGHWQPPAHRPTSLPSPRQFRFLNQDGDLDKLGWDDPGTDKLWRYNQHYFDDLNAHGAAARHGWHLSLLEDWVDQNPPGKRTGWEPYPTSLRIANWVKWSLSGNDLPGGCRQCLAVQARWLTRRLERHLLGNHLFANAKALIYAGLWFEGDEARKWLETGFGILAWEVPEQILPDGGQFELSTMYHSLAVEDMLDLINVARSFPEALTADQKKQVVDWEARIPTMLHWLHTLCHPDGRIAFFNDAAFGIAPSVEELGAYAGRLGFPAPKVDAPLVWLADSGYGRLSLPEATLLIDMARVGPDYLPGHAHADTLSCEFSLHGQRVIVNSGTSLYGTSPERLRQRGTAAHSTVFVAGRNSSEVWGGFRVARRAKILSARVHQEGDTLIAEGTHDGYRRLSGRPVHRRRWQLSPGSLMIEDMLSDDRHPAEARFHLHPDITATQIASDRGACRLPSGQQLSWRVRGGEARLEPSSWHPEFGLSLPSTCLVLDLRGPASALSLSWN